jgi:hypothetical protein
MLSAFIGASRKPASRGIGEASGRASADPRPARAGHCQRERLGFALIRMGTDGHGETNRVILAASTVAIVAIAAAVIVVALALWYILPRGGRRRR